MGDSLVLLPMPVMDAIYNSKLTEGHLPQSCSALCNVLYKHIHFLQQNFNFLALRLII